MVSVRDKEEVKFFLDELNENLEYLDELIINLEENPDDKETLEEIFRVAHTIKGSAGFLDLKNLVALGHAMENVFEDFKTGKTKVNKEVIDTILECKDAIGKIGTLLGSEQDTEQIDTNQLIEKVNSFAQSSTETPVKKAPTKVPTSETENDDLTANDYIPDTTLVRVWISQDEPAPAIRAFLIQKNISDIAEIVQQSPSEEELDSEDFAFPKNRELRFWIKTDLPDDKVMDYAKVDLVDKVGLLHENTLKRLSNGKGPAQSGLKNIGHEDIEVTETVRIPVSRLDVMLNLVGELVIANSGFNQIQETLRDVPKMGETYKKISDRTKDLVRISADIQELVMKSRLVPISQVFNRFKRFVRDFSSKSGKKVKLTMTGENTEIDKKIIDEMIKPLTHLVRNSLDHGIEDSEERRLNGKSPVATLHLKAGQEGNYINVSIEDDGRGLNFDRILEKAIQQGIITDQEAVEYTEEEIKHLIFHSGFSTKDKADEMSGRGVGMDVVKRSVENLNGTIILESEPQKGTSVLIKLPLTLAILNALIIRIGKEKFCIPMSSIVETQKVAAKNFLTVENNEMVRLRDDLIPVVRLEKIFPPELLDSEATENSEGKKEEDVGFSPAKPEILQQDTDEYPIIVVEYHNTAVAILVDQLINRQEMVIKSLAEHYRSLDGISGASILGDGSIILIIDVHGVIQLFQSSRSKLSQDISPTFASQGSAFDLANIAQSKKTKSRPPSLKEKATSSSKSDVVQPSTTNAQPPVEKTKEEKKEPIAETPLSYESIVSMSAEEFDELEPVDTKLKTPEEEEKEKPAINKEHTYTDVLAEPKVDQEVKASDSPEQTDTLEQGQEEKHLLETSISLGKSIEDLDIPNKENTLIEIDMDKNIQHEMAELEISWPENKAIKSLSAAAKNTESSSSKKDTFIEVESMAKKENKNHKVETGDQVEDNSGEELSEFEKMKQNIDLMDEIYPDKNLAISHFDQDNLDFTKLNEILDGKDQEALKQWLTEGSNQAIEGIKSLTGNDKLRQGKIKAKKYNSEKVIELFTNIKSLGEEVIIMKLPVLPLSGVVYLLLTRDNAITIAGKLYEAANMDAPVEVNFEPLMEVTNILGSSFTNTLTQITDIPVEPGLPEIIENEEIALKSLKEDLSAKNNRILYIENQLLWENKTVLADILIIIPALKD